MKIHLLEKDIRFIKDSNFEFNMGSFSKIIWNINKCLKKENLYSEIDLADWVGFSSGLDLDFGFQNKNRFLIHVWESNILPIHFINFRKSIKNYRFFGLSEQISNVWRNYGFKTDIVDIGVDTEFWKKDNNIKKNDKFTILSVTSCNFRSGVYDTIESFLKIWELDNNVKLIIKDTDERNKILPLYVNKLKNNGIDIEYICERMDDFKIRELYLKSHLVCYNPIITSAGLPILEAASCEIPCIVGDFCPTNIYPSSEVIKCIPVSIESQKQKLIEFCGLPYTFPENFIDEMNALIYKFDIDNFINKILEIKNNYDFYKSKCIKNRKICETNWTWNKSTNKLIEYLSN